VPTANSCNSGIKIPYQRIIFASGRERGNSDINKINDLRDVYQFAREERKEKRKNHLTRVVGSG
jgi:hypothetical protein